MHNNLSILIVEDNSSDARLIQELLIEADRIKGNFLIAKTLSEALNRLKSDKIDLILLDLGLPDSQGLDTFRKIKNISSNIPIIILTGLQDEEVALSCLKEDAQDYINKDGLDGKSLSRSIAFAFERKLIEKNLQEYASVLSASNDAIYSKDLNGIITLWNRGAERLYGYKAEEMIGQHVSKLIPEESRHEVENIITLIKEDKDLQEYETVRLTKNGQRINVILNAAPIKNKLNKITGISIICHNITRIKQNEAVLAIEFRIATVLAESVDLISAAHCILKTICEILDWQIGEMWVVDQEKNLLQCVNRWSSSTISAQNTVNSNNIFFKMGEDLPGYVWQTKEPVFIPNLTQFNQKSQPVTFFPNDLSCCFGFPITLRENILGIVLLFSKKKKEIDYNFQIMVENIGKQIGNFIIRKDLEGNLLYLAEHDTLTGLANRKFFLNKLKSEIIHCKPIKNRFALLFLDLDLFKKVNDSFGHNIGDKLLLAVSERLHQAVRASDTVARLGGDEFAILLTNVERMDVIVGVATKILNLISEPFRIDQEELFITISIGISIYPVDGENPNTLLRKADQAMYLAKQSGKNAYQFSQNVKSIFSREKYVLENELHHALENNEMILYYQPIVNVNNLQIIGVEALIRWVHPSGTLLSPISFIPLAIESSFILKLGDWIITTACEQLIKWNKAGLNISINIASPQLNIELLKTIKKIISKTNINPNRIVLEVTEQVLMFNTEKNIDLIKEINELGIKIAIDDFGTGYSSFVYLKTFRVDIIKIDRSFTKDLPYNLNSVAIVRAMIAMAKEMHIKVIAEGIETEEQYNFIKQNGCDLFQGFYLSKPLPEDKLIELLSKQEYLWIK